MNLTFSKKGTPVQNSLSDLEPLLRFVGLDFDKTWFGSIASGIENPKYANTQTGSKVKKKNNFHSFSLNLLI